MKAYSEYKASNIEWLGDIPVHWDILPCRAIVRSLTKKNEDNSINNYLSLMANIGIIPYEDKGDIGNKKPEDLTKCKIVKKGNLVINSMNYAIGSYGISAYDGICSPVYIVLETNNHLVTNRYTYWLFDNKPLQKHLSLLGNGILEHRAAIKWDDIKPQHVAIPPKQEQELIADFLDHETSRIDQLIFEKQTFIKLLEEKRQALIGHVVTKGLNPNVKMKDSGIEWIGVIPEHWELMSHRRLIKKIEQGWSPQADNTPPNGSQWGVTKLSAVKFGIFYPEECKAMLNENNPNNGLKLNDGDFLITRANTPELVGDVCIVKGINNRNIILCDLIYRIHYMKTVEPEYLRYWFLSQSAKKQIKINARGSSMSMVKIAQSHIKAWKIPLPALDIQKDIVNYLSIQSEKLNHIIKETENSITLLKEHRTALISAAITGKIDIRDYQKGTQP